MDGLRLREMVHARPMARKTASSNARWLTGAGDATVARSSFKGEMVSDIDKTRKNTLVRGSQPILADIRKPFARHSDGQRTSAGHIVSGFERRPPVCKSRLRVKFARFLRETGLVRTLLSSCRQEAHPCGTTFTLFWPWRCSHQAVLAALARSADPAKKARPGPIPSRASASS